MSRRSKTGVRGLYRGKGGLWQIDLRWFEPGTQQWRRYREKLPANTTTAAAKERARDILNAALAGGFDPDKIGPPKLKAALDEYIRWCETNRPKDVAKRKARGERFVAAFGDSTLDGISPLDIERFKRDRKAGDVSAATVNRDLETLKHFFGLAASWGWVSKAHVLALRAVNHLKEPPGRVRYLTHEEENAILGALPKGVRPIVEAALLSGMRQGELLTLRKEAVDLAARVILLTRTKSNKVRPVYVSDALARVLERAIAASTSPYVFTNTKGGPYTQHGLGCMFRRAVTKAGVQNFRFHDLRHTTATRLRQQGVGIDAIADVLGHSTLAMAKRYTHLGRETLRAAMDSLPTPAGGSAESGASVIEFAQVKAPAVGSP